MSYDIRIYVLVSRLINAIVLCPTHVTTGCHHY